MATSDLPRPEPVTKAGTIAGAVAAVIITVGGLAKALGWISDDLDTIEVANQTSNLILGAGALWSILAPLVLALWARGKVTPLQDPRDAAGNQLHPVVDGEVAGPVVDVPVSGSATPEAPSSGGNSSGALPGAPQMAGQPEGSAADDDLDIAQAIAKLDQIGASDPGPVPAPSSPAPAPAESTTPTYDQVAASLAAAPTAVIPAVAPAVDPADETRPMQAVANGTVSS